MIHVPANSAVSATPAADPGLVDVVEFFIGAGLPDEEIARTLDVDPWSVALLRAVLTAFDAVEAHEDHSSGHSSGQGA